MPVCKYCGDEIEFRSVDGQTTPIHVNGGWCAGYPSAPSGRSAKPYESVVSYVNPNAHCPVCGETVFFYQNPFGGRVFFDDLGWPWPKHGCTDNTKSQAGPVKPAAQRSRKPFFLSKAGEALHVYRIVEHTSETDAISLKFSRVDQPLMAFRLSIPRTLLKANDVTLDDLQRAPAFVVRFHEDYRLVEFISGRKKEVESLRVPRLRPPTGG
jgi:hypothetical protein